MILSSVDLPEPFRPKEAERYVFQNMALGRDDFADPVHGENVLGHGMTL
jgi:hypothetical protein